MIKYIHHISDVHIRLLKRHAEFKKVFETLYNNIKNNLENSIIILTGDIVHSKVEISPELIDVTSEFFTKLADLTKLIIIPGNHDCNLNNKSRLDSLSPIIENLKHPNIIYSKNTEIIELENLQIAHQSIFSEKSQFVNPTMLDPDKVKIALYHGTVSGAKINGNMSGDSNIKVEDFDGFDMVLLGDIHEAQCLKKENPCIWYAGSLLQNNYGEKPTKGYLLWDVYKKSPTFIKIENDYGFHTIEVIGGKYTIPADMSRIPRIRLKVSNTTSSDLHRISTNLRKSYNVKEIIINNVDRNSTQLTQHSRSATVDVRNLETQNKLIKDFVDNKFGINDPDILNRIFKINKEINAELSQNETARNVTWIPKKFEFSNMFSYGEDNVIDFSKLQHVVGLFAPNASGKSSLIDALMFCIFDKSSRAFKGIDILNSRKLTFTCKFNFEIDGIDFFIERRGFKKKNGSVKIDVDFWTIGDDGTVISLNGESRDDTNQNIRGYIGTYEDFVTSAMSFQNNSNSFIEKSQTERKDFLSKFLDINIFDDLYTISNEKIKEINVLLSEYKKQDFSVILADLELKLDSSNAFVSNYREKKNSLESQEQKLNSEILSETAKKIPTSAEFIDVDSCKKIIDDNNISISELKDRCEKLENRIFDYKSSAVSIYTQINELKQKDVENLYIEYKSASKKYSSILQSLHNEITKLEHKKKNLNDLSQYDYDPNCKWCVNNNNIFISHSATLRDEIKILQDVCDSLSKDADTLKNSVDSLHIYESLYNQLTSLSKQLDEKKIVALKADTDRNNLLRQLDSLELANKDLISKLEEYEKNKIAIQHNHLIDNSISILKRQLETTISNRKSVDVKLQEAVSKVEVYKNEVSKIHTLMNNTKDMENKFKAYELYSKSVCRDGVPYELISNVIPMLQEEVNDILSQIVDFNIIFNLDGKNINAVICYDDTQFWPIELVSGMEKFITSLAIRCALLNVSNLSRPTFLAIDEGFGVMDADNLSSLNYLFDYLKQKFDFVLIVSHIDTMKDMVDFSIDISKHTGFSKISYM